MSTIHCHYCRKWGHMVSECRKKKQDLGTSKLHLNSAASDDLLYMFSTIILGPIPYISTCWYLDSGVSQHMSPIQTLFWDYQVLFDPKTKLLGDNKTYNALRFGSILFKLNIGQSLLIKDVLYVTRLAKNLLSVVQITSTGNTIVTFTHDQCVIKTTPKILFSMYLFIIYSRHSAWLTTKLFNLNQYIDSIHVVQSLN